MHGRESKVVLPSILENNKVVNVDLSKEVRFFPGFAIVINHAGDLHANDFFALVLPFLPCFLVNFDHARINGSDVISRRVAGGLKHDRRVFHRGKLRPTNLLLEHSDPNGVFEVATEREQHRFPLPEEVLSWPSSANSLLSF